MVRATIVAGELISVIAFGGNWFPVDTPTVKLLAGRQFA